MSNSNIEPELNSLLTKLTVEIRNDQSEIELRSKRIEKNETLLRAVRASLAALHPERKTAGYGAKSDTIKDAISRITATRFTQDDVQNEIKKLNPDLEINRNRIRSALWTLAASKELIQQVTKGNNRQPAEFEKIEAKARSKRTTEQVKDETSHSGNGESVHQVFVASNRDVSVENIKKVISNMGAGRAGAVAKALETSVDKIQVIIDSHPDFFEKVGKGWIKVKN